MAESQKHYIEPKKAATKGYCMLSIKVLKWAKLIRVNC